MKNTMLLIETVIPNEVGYMDLWAEIEDDKFVIVAENHDGYQWETGCPVEDFLMELEKAKGGSKMEPIKLNVDRTKVLLDNMIDLLETELNFTKRADFISYLKTEAGFTKEELNELGVRVYDAD